MLRILNRWNSISSMKIEGGGGGRGGWNREIQKRKANGENGAKRGEGGGERGRKETEKVEAEAARAEYDVDPLHETDTGYTWDTGGRAAV